MCNNMSSSLPPTQTSEEDILQCVICYRDIVDPVLLTCLHSACSSCTKSDGNESVTCPTCQATTDAPIEKTNLIVSTLAHRSKVLRDVFSCMQCKVHDNPDAIAVIWCYTCQHSFCVDCQKSHSKLHSTHIVMHLNESTNLSELYCPPPRLCKKHKVECTLACFTCKDGRCYKCAHECYTSSHDVLPLDGPDALTRMNDSVTQAKRLLSELFSSLTPLQAHLSLPEKFLGAREESLATLKNAKKRAIDSISDAHDNSAESLLECWDSLLVHSVTHRENAERLNRRVSWTSEYCKLALNSNDVAGLLPQLDEVLSSLQTLQEEVRHFQEPVDPSKLVRFNTWLPNDMNLIASGWFGRASVTSDDLKPSLKGFASEAGADYYKRKVSTLEELESILQSQKQEQALVQFERQEMAKLKSEFALKDQELVAVQNEVKKGDDKQKELQAQLENERRTVKQLQTDLNLKTQQHVASQNEVKKVNDQQKELQVQLENERRTVKQLQTDLNLKTQQHVAVQNEVKKVNDQQKELQAQLENERRIVKQLQTDLNLKTQQHAASENEKKNLRDQQQEQQKQLDRERRTVEQLQSELKFAAPTKPLSFDSKPRGTFKGPGRCWDVAVTPQGRLLVAAMADGLKEYDATSFREIATWKPDAALLGQEKNFWIMTVNVLSDGRALVGLNPKLVVLLRRDVVSGGYGSSSSSSAAAEGWRVERRVAAELQAPPRRLSAWDDRLLAVLEDRYDDNKKSWRCGPGLVLFSLRDGDKQLHRQRLDYNACCVALTDRGVIVSSQEQVELTAAGGSSNIKCYVVDCYSHVGVRLWRHESAARGLRSDSVGRVLYAAKRGSVVALSTDDGRELSSALALSTTETNRPYALSLDNVTQCRLVLISRGSGVEPNIITIFSVA